jgi:hypothetical protein
MKKINNLNEKTSSCYTTGSPIFKKLMLYNTLEQEKYDFRKQKHQSDQKRRGASKITSEVLIRKDWEIRNLIERKVNPCEALGKRDKSVQLSPMNMSAYKTYTGNGVSRNTKCQFSPERTGIVKTSFLTLKYAHNDAYGFKNTRRECLELFEMMKQLYPPRQTKHKPKIRFTNKLLQKEIYS